MAEASERMFRPAVTGARKLTIGRRMAGYPILGLGLRVVKEHR